jgi:hypothetical protein
MTITYLFEKFCLVGHSPSLLGIFLQLLLLTITNSNSHALPTHTFTNTFNVLRICATNHILDLLKILTNKFWYLTSKMQLSKSINNEKPQFKANRFYKCIDWNGACYMLTKYPIKFESFKKRLIRPCSV